MIPPVIKIQWNVAYYLYLGAAKHWIDPVNVLKNKKKVETTDPDCNIEIRQTLLFNQETNYLDETGISIHQW